MSSPYTVYVLKFEQNDLRPGASPSSSELRRAGNSMIYLPPPVRFRATARPAGRDPGPRPLRARPVNTERLRGTSQPERHIVRTNVLEPLCADKVGRGAMASARFRSHQRRCSRERFEPVRMNTARNHSKARGWVCGDARWHEYVGTRTR